MKTEERKWVCPAPLGVGDRIQMAHGGGGKRMKELIDGVFRRYFDNRFLNQNHDAVVLPVEKGNPVLTTDSFVIRPLFFPGGDIGSLSVNGTVNDLAMAGARPLYLTAGFILEEGLPLKVLEEVVQSMAQAAKTANIFIVTGDTKVVDKGKADGLYINTAGYGVLEQDHSLLPKNICPGDLVLVSGDVGRHGMAVMSVREGLEFDSPLQSDAAPLWPLVSSLFSEGVRVRCLRDMTRGGLASALNELAETSSTTIEIIEEKVPVSEEVKNACEILGLDPFYVANEGRFVAFVDPRDEEKALSILRRCLGGEESSLVGVVQEGNGYVKLKTSMGVERVLDMLSGEQMPRIC